MICATYSAVSSGVIIAGPVLTNISLRCLTLSATACKDFAHFFHFASSAAMHDAASSIHRHDRPLVMQLLFTLAPLCVKPSARLRRGDAEPSWLARALLCRRTAEHLTGPANGRSEEHTSELQSLMRISNAVFCLKTHTLITNHIL